MANGTRSFRARVRASRVLPVPVGPISRTLDFSSPTSSARIFFQTCTPSSQMNTPGPAMSRRATSALLPQNEQTLKPGSLFGDFAILHPLEDLVDDPVLQRFLRGPVEVAFA